MKKLLLIVILTFPIANSNWIDLSWCYKKTFTLSAYYSAIKNQSFYYKWSYSKEIRLNGRWTHGASWKAVFNGMLAGPKNYKFWTKIYLPWLGVGQIEDRWQAIVNAWQRWEKFDRIDIWVGKWDQALMRALTFWKQVKVWYICPSTKNFKIWFDYSNFFIFKNFFEKTFWWVWMSFWRNDKWVKLLQEHLKKLWYFNYYKTTWYFWPITKQAVSKFQKDSWILTNYYGYFGPQTRIKLKQALKQKWLYKNNNKILKLKEKSITKEENKNIKQENNIVSKDMKILKRGLWKWYNTYEVKVLQKYLSKLGYYKWDIDWYYDDKTIKAVANFQFKHKIIKPSNKYLAWYFGPKTRETFKQVVIESFYNS